MITLKRLQNGHGQSSVVVLDAATFSHLNIGEWEIVVLFSQSNEIKKRDNNQRSNITGLFIIKNRGIK